MNNESHNPLKGDTNGPITALDKTIIGILVNPSADTWRAVLTDKYDNVIFDYSGKITNQRSEYIPLRLFTDGISYSALNTNITNIYIYTNES